jgi:hypothetical protein
MVMTSTAARPQCRKQLAGYPALVHFQAQLSQYTARMEKGEMSCRHCHKQYSSELGLILHEVLVHEVLYSGC